MATPFATRGTGDLIIRDGDTVSGDSATGGAGGNLTVEGGDATVTTHTDGGDVVLQPGREDGTGAIGEISVTNRTGTEDDPIIAFDVPLIAFEDPFFIELHKKLRSMDRSTLDRSLRELRISPERFREIFATGKGSRDELDRLRRHRWQ